MAASFTSIAFPAYIKLHAFLYAGGYINAYRFFAINSSVAFAGSALRSDGGTLAITSGTGGDCLHLTQESILHSSYLAASTTGFTGLNAALIFSTAATAGIALNVFLNLDVFLNAPGYFFKGHF